MVLQFVIVIILNLLDGLHDRAQACIEPFHPWQDGDEGADGKMRFDVAAPGPVVKPSRSRLSSVAEWKRVESEG